jgi:ATP-binding cassette, subfamily B (MDR/TAP), member 1
LVSLFLVIEFWLIIDENFYADEATSALDATSRLLVFEAIKRWRTNKTTIVITHDFSQISSSDFVYVLKGGRVVEQGYRYDLEEACGEFRDMMDAQGATGGFLLEKEAVVPDRQHLDVIFEQAEAEKEAEQESVGDNAGRFNLKHQSLIRLVLRPVTLGNWMVVPATSPDDRPVSPA